MVLLWATTSSLAADWTEKPALSTSPATLLAAARRSLLTPPDDGDLVRVLLDETVVRLSADGRDQIETRRIFAVLTDDSDDWDQVSVGYRAWYENRPRIEARVVAPDGGVRRLDATHVHDGPDPDGQGDARRVTAELPALSRGSVVETMTVRARHAPYFAAGSLHALVYGGDPDTERERVAVHVPQDLALAWVAEPDPGFSWAKRRSQRVLTLDVSAGNRPFDAGTLLLSTVPAWSTIASAYSSQLDDVLLADEALEQEAHALGGVVISPQWSQRIEAARHRVAQIDLLPGVVGEAGVLPRVPSDILEEGEGDGKDRAIVLVGLLRAIGESAHVAFLKAGPGPDVPLLPGLEGFDRAIVRVDGPTGPVWIDPSAAWMPLGALPFESQGRLALVVSPGTEALSVTPSEPPDRNKLHVSCVVVPGAKGGGRLEETITATGAVAERFRRLQEDKTPAQVDGRNAARAGTTYGGVLAGTVQVVDPRSFLRGQGETPLTQSLALVDPSIVRTTGVGTAVGLPWKELFSLLPAWASDLALVAPLMPVSLPPHHAVVDYQIAIPSGLLATELPTPRVERFGPIGWELTSSRGANGVAVKLSLTVDEGAVAPTELLRMRTALAQVLDGPPPVVRFVDPLAHAFAEGRVGDAVQIASSAVASAPEDPAALDRLARTLLFSRFGVAARVPARAAMTLAPEDLDVLRNSAYILMHDEVGRTLEAGYPRGEALEALRRALALAPDDADVLALLASVQETAADGRVYGPGTDPMAAALALEHRRVTAGTPDLDWVLAAELIQAEAWQALGALARDSADPLVQRLATTVAAVVGPGVDVLLAELPRTGPSQAQREELAFAVGVLLKLRRYDEAQKVHAAIAGAGVPVPSIVVARLVAHESLVFDEMDPAALVRRWFTELARRKASDRRRRLAKSAPDGLSETLDRVVTEAQRWALDLIVGDEPGGRSEALAVDAWLAAAEVTANGSPEVGFQVTVLPAPGVVGPTHRLYLVRERGSLRLRALSSHPELLAAEALARATAGDAVGAEVWLAWSGMAPGDPSGPAAVVGMDPRLSVSLRASLSMVRESPFASQVLPPALRTLTAARGTLPPELDHQLARAVLRGWVALEDDAAVLATIETDTTGVIGTEALFAGAGPALRQGAGLSWLERVRRARMSRPEDVELAMLAVNLGFALGEEAAVDQAVATLLTLDHSGLDPAEVARVAWAAAQHDRHASHALTWSQAALDRDPTALARQARVAALLAAGRPDEAHAHLAAHFDEGGGPLDEGWRYLQGRLAEAFGLPAAAAAIYATLAAPTPGSATDSRRLAAARAAALR